MPVSTEPTTTKIRCGGYSITVEGPEDTDFRLDSVVMTVQEGMKPSPQDRVEAKVIVFGGSNV